MRFNGFIGPSYTLQSLDADCQNTVNWYPEANDLGTGKEQEQMFLAPTPGLKLFATLPQGPVRGVWRSSSGELYVVGGNKFYKVSSTGMVTELGQLNTSTGPVSIADNGLQIIIVDGPNGYFFTLASGMFNVITDPDFPGADQVTFQDGYFIFNQINSQRFFISGLNDVTFDGLDIATAEASPDLLVGLISSNQNLYLFGSQSIEVYYNSGDADFPFQRIQGAVVNVGCSAPFSIYQLPGGTLVWLGGDASGVGIVYKMVGYQAQRVSNSAVEASIRALTIAQIAQARAWVYQQSGHVFYVLSIPGLAYSWVLDLSNNLWHQRAYLNPTNLNPAGLERHRADCQIVVYGVNMVGDYENGKLYALDPNTLTDDGVAIKRLRTAPHLTKGLRNIFHSSFQLDMEVGVGLDGVGQGTDPQVMLQWSNDGGHTWSNEHWRSIGKIGEKKKRIIWRRIGRARDRVYRVMITDPVKAVLLGAELGVEEGVS